jgi:predicted secreted hydrolase
VASRIEERFEGSPLEWWYVHGSMRNPAGLERYFMFSLFRFRVSGACGQPLEPCMAMLSLLDPAADCLRVSSRVDSVLLAVARDRVAAKALDPYLPAPALDELARFGFPREFETVGACPELRVEPFCCRWEDLAIKIDKGGCQLSFREPQSKLEYELELQPEVPRLVVETAQWTGSRDRAMQYAAYPRLRLQGTVDGSRVSGTAWLDHQWGGRAWIESEDSPPRPAGWDWLGFHLEDGSSWIAIKHWDVGTRAEHFRCLTVREASGEVRVVHSFEWQPTRWWHSPWTRASYPVECSLRATEFDADVSFAPLADNQEVRMLGSMRAVWQGAGVVQGHVSGRPVKAEARLEGQGYGYVLSPSDYLDRWDRRVDAVYSGWLPPGSKDVKRRLAVLHFLLFEVLGVNDRVFGQDGMNYRQTLSVWSAWLRLIVRVGLLPNGNPLGNGRLTRSTLDAAMRDGLGPRIRRVYTSRAGAIADELARAWVSMADLSEGTGNALRCFAASMGEAVQLAEDARGFGGSPRLGQAGGAALAGGRVNYVVFRALQLLPPAASERLRDILCDHRVRKDPNALDEGIDLVGASGACESVRAEAREIFGRAWQEFSGYAVPSYAKTELRLALESLLE